MISSPVRRFALVLLTMAAALSPLQVRAEGWPAQVHAIYRINFNGLDLGTFDFNSRVKDNSYQLTGNANVSALFGAYEWKGLSRASGLALQAGPQPASYYFAFKSNSKAGNVHMTFADTSVAKIVADPPIRSSVAAVPLKEAHLKGVVDPLSAVLALAKPASGRTTGINPCARRVGIFDGKQRFDIALSFKRQASITEVGGRNGNAIVCRVKYIPVAGHKLNEETRSMMQATGIEIWMLPMPEAGLFVPYHIVIPTMAGNATMTVDKISIDTTRGRIALTH
ncbi:MAG: DUF3108 domain-containing protein [Hyphomicrobiaceae bacterium]|nr:MAG: DUF3108 domain-containing protein [Hyphomicrobiaceae bacterium]